MNTLKDLNISLTDSQGNMRDVVEVYTDVANAIKDISDVDRIKVVEALSGKYHISRMQALLDDLGNADSMYRKMFETSVDSDGSAFRENEIYMKSLQARMNLMRVEVEKLALALGEAFLTEGMISFMAIASKMLQTISTITSSFGGLPLIIGTAIAGIYLMSKSFRTLSTSVGQTTAAIALLSTNKKALAASSVAYQSALMSTVATTGKFNKVTSDTAVAARTLTRSKQVVTASTQQFSNATKDATRNISSYNQTLTAHRGNVEAVRAGTNGMNSVMGMGTKIANGMKIAFVSMGGAIVTALPFIAIGILIEKLMKAKEASRQLKETAVSSGKEMVNSYKSNKDELDTLIFKYKKLETAVNSGNYDLETLNEYYEVQDKIGTLLPSLATGEDQYGRKLIETSSTVSTKIELLREQLEIEQDIAEWEAKKGRTERIEGNAELIKENTKAYEEELKVIQRRMEHFRTGHADVLPIPKIKNTEDLNKYLEEIAEQRKIAEKDGNNKVVKYYDTLAKSIIETQQALSGYSIATKNSQSSIRLDKISELNDLIEDSGNLSMSSKEKLQEFNQEMLKLSDLELSGDLSEAFSKIFIGIDKDSPVINIINEFGKLDKATSETFDSVVANIETSIASVKKALSGSGLSDSEINAVIETLNKKLNVSKTAFAEVADEMKRSGGTFEEVKARMAEHATEIDSATDAHKEFADRLKDTTDSISYINGVLEDYTENGKLSSSTLTELIGKYPTLIDYIDDEANLIKELTRLRDEDISAAKKQMAEKLMISEKFYENNLKLIEAFVKQQFSFYEGDLQGFKNLAEAKGAVEVQLINELAKKWGVYYNKQAEAFSMLPQLAPNEVKQGSTSFGFELEDLKNATAAQNELNASRKIWEDFAVDKITLDFGKLGTSLDDVNKSASKSAKDSAKSTKESIYITDAYKLAMEELNLAIEKQQKLQNQFPTHSASYRKAIEAEIKLQKEKLNLMNAQATALEKQIKSGKIAQTGNVTIGDGNSKSSTTTTSKRNLGGWQGGITSGYGAQESFRKSPHTGIDIQGKKGTRLDSNVNGKVEVVGKNDVSGKYVVVMDDNGYRHFYGHLDDIAVAVKDVVKMGDQLGKIGNTGRVVAGKGGDGSHLHYEVKKNGSNINPIDFVNSAKAVKNVATQASTAVSNTKQSIDDAKSTLTGLKGEIVNQTDLIEKLEFAIVESYLEGFEHRRSVIDAHYAHEEAKLKNVNRASSQYNKTIDGMNALLERKQKANQDELNYINELIKKGGLSAKTLEDMNSRTLALKTSIQALNNEMGQLKFDQLIDKFDDSIKKQDHVLAYESVKIDELDKNSSRYTATLDKLNTHINRKLELTKADIAETNKLISSGKYSGEVLANMKDRVQELTTSLKELAHEIANNNYEVVVNIRTRSNEIVDDLQFEIDRSKAYQGMYKEGSADATNEIQKQISLYEQMAKQHDETRRKLQAELKQRDLLPEQIKEITELMEDETNAYWNAKTSIDSLTKSIEETNKRLREEIANKLINAYKEYVGERRDEHLKVLEDELDAEQKRHDKLKKMWQDELDLFRKNIEERLKMIDRAEASRSYQMDIDDMESERKKVVDKINLLSIDNSHEAKSKTKKLKEELDKIDKDLAEKRHQRDIELQKQSLNDMLEQKEDDNSNREELEDERLQAVVDRINREKKYWEKHYSDLLNDERKFAQIREDIMNGHFEKVLVEFEGYISEMEATMPRLADTMDGTMRAVGTAIRENVIGNLREAMNAINEFNAMQIATNSIKDDFNPNESKDTTYSGNTSTENIKNPPSSSQPTSSNNQSNKGQVYASLNRGDMQVLFGKFINDVVAPTFKAETKERVALKNEGIRLAGLGRNNSSQIPVNSAFNKEIGNLTASQVDQLKSFIQSNAGSILGGNYTSAFNKNLASLHTGGYVNSSGSGVDGMGGKLSLLHPKEVVLDKIDTKRLFQNIEVSDTLSKSLASMTSSFASIFKGMTPTFATGGGSITENYNIQFGDVHNTTQGGAKDFARMIQNEIKLKKGGY